MLNNLSPSPVYAPYMPHEAKNSTRDLPLHSTPWVLTQQQKVRSQKQTIPGKSPGILPGTFPFSQNTIVFYKSVLS